MPHGNKYFAAVDHARFIFPYHSSRIRKLRYLICHQFGFSCLMHSINVIRNFKYNQQLAQNRVICLIVLNLVTTSIIMIGYDGRDFYKILLFPRFTGHRLAANYSSYQYSVFALKRSFRRFKD